MVYNDQRPVTDVGYIFAVFATKRKHGIRIDTYTHTGFSISMTQHFNISSRMTSRRGCAIDKHSKLKH